MRMWTRTSMASTDKLWRSAGHAMSEGCIGSVAPPRTERWRLSEKSPAASPKRATSVLHTGKASLAGDVRPLGSCWRSSEGAHPWQEHCRHHARAGREAANVHILIGPASEHTMGPSPGTAFVICVVALTSLAAAPAAGMGLGYLAASDAAASELGTAARGRTEGLMRRSLSQVGPSPTEAPLRACIWLPWRLLADICSCLTVRAVTAVPSVEPVLQPAGYYCNDCCA